MKNNINYIFRRVVAFFIIFIIMSFIKSCDVHAKTMNPRYATINSNYLWNDSKIVSANQLQFNISSGGSSYVAYCISTSGVDTDYTDEFYHHAQIDICTNSSSSWSLYSGGGYAAVDGYVDFDNSACSIAGYAGHIARVYVHLLDWTTPSGGADFSWSCFTTQQKNNSNYTTLNKILNIQLTDNSYYETQKAEQDLIRQQSATTNAINSQTTTQHNDSVAEQNAINSNTNAVNNQTNTMKDDSVDAADSKASEWANKSLSDNAVASMVTMPITLLNAYLSGLNGSCSPYSLGTLYDHEIILPCISISGILGSSLWGIIDVLFSGFMIYAIGKKFVKIFNDFTNLKDNQVDELYGGGN